MEAHNSDIISAWLWDISDGFWRERQQIALPACVCLECLLSELTDCGHMWESDQKL